MHIIPLDSHICAPELARTIELWLNQVHAEELAEYDAPVGLSVRYGGPDAGSLLTVRTAEKPVTTQTPTSLVGKYVRIIEGQHSEFHLDLGVVRSHDLQTGRMSVYLNRYGLLANNVHISEVKVVERPERKEEE